MYNNIREFRKKLGLNQSQLGKRIGVSKNVVSAWKCGYYEPSLYHVCLLLTLFDCSFWDLFYFE